MSSGEPMVERGQKAVQPSVPGGAPVQRKGAEASPVYERKTRLTVRDESLTLEIPPPGLDVHGVARVVAAIAGGLAALVVALMLPGGALGWAGRVLSGCGGLILLGAGAYAALRARMDAASVRVTRDGIEVTHNFPSPKTEGIGRSDYSGIMIGRRGRVDRGYTCQDWGPYKGELVVTNGKTRLHFGEGLPAAEQQWLRETISDRLPDPVPLRNQGGADLSVAAPPERFWRDITRYAVCALAGALVLLALLLSAGARGPSAGSALVLAVFLAVVATLGYRSFRLERALGDYHRAVVKYEAALMDLTFSPSDVGGIARKLPDFSFFDGPRRLYNVAWSESDPAKMILFDYTTSSRSPMWDGMACAVAINKLSQEAVSMRPRLWPALTASFLGMRLPGHPDFERKYCVRAENEGRARTLLGPQVVGAVMAWPGPGPAPYVCIQGGMVGLSMHRRHAASDKTTRQFYAYGVAIREAVLARLRELRS
jgi:hypothetical protein